MRRHQVIPLRPTSPVAVLGQQTQAFHVAASELSSSWCTVRGVRLAEDVWLGLAPQGSMLAESVRLSGRMVALCEVAGHHALVDAEAVVLDQPRAAFDVPREVVARETAALTLRLDESARTVALVFRVAGVRAGYTDEGEGAIPRT